MYQNDRVGVVIPAYNESGFVGEVIDTVPDFVDRVYAIDDCSTDDTWAEIQQRATSNDRDREAVHPDGGTQGPKMIPIRHETNKGVGGAIKTGYRQSLADGNDVTAVMNGDGQMDPEILDRIIQPVVDGRADFAKGNRLTSPEYREEMTRWRFVGNATLTLLTKIASGYWGVNDPQNGYTAISRGALETVDIDSLYDRFGFCNDLLVHLNRNGLRIEDVGMPARYRDETSHIRYSSFVPMMSILLLNRFLWRLKTKYIVQDFHPLVFFYGIGQLAVWIAAGAIAFIAVTGSWTLVSVLLSVLLFLVGCLSTVWAMTLDKNHSEGYS